MINTLDFCTRTDFIPRKNASTGPYWGIALDIGYSAVKGMSPNSVFCFPSFARPFTGKLLNLGDPSPTDIQYRNEHGEIWNVGAMAQAAINANDSNDSTHSLYSRNRYDSEMFLVLARVGLALGMRENSHGAPKDKPIMVQTGLPPAYLRSDAPILKEVLSGHHEFEIRSGDGTWESFVFDLNEDNVRVMAQPMGSFFSAALSNEATQVASAKQILTSNILIFDAGFGTVDIYSIRNRQIENNSQSFDDCGMKAVFQETVDMIQREFRTEVKVHTMQKCLRAGVVQKFDPRRMQSTHVKFDHLLEAANTKVCMKAIERIKTMYNYLADYDYLLITGGTGAAWQDIITDHFAGMETLKVITGSQNDTLSHIYSNVRGYYLHQAGKLQREK